MPFVLTFLYAATQNHNPEPAYEYKSNNANKFCTVLKFYVRANREGRPLGRIVAKMCKFWARRQPVMTQFVEISMIVSFHLVFDDQKMSTDHSHHRQLHRFRYSRWAARRAAAAVMVVLYTVLLWAMLGQSNGSGSWLEIVFVALVAVMALMYLLISQHPVTRLSVGPEGISLPFSLVRSIAWSDIAEARYVTRQTVLLPQREWIDLHIKPGTTRLARFAMPKRLEDILISQRLRIPLHVLGAPSGEVLSSIERFMPVIDADATEMLKFGAATRP